MRILVSPVKGDPYLVEVPRNARVSDLKHSIYVISGFKPSVISLAFRGKILSDNEDLISAKLHDMSKVFLAIDKKSIKPKVRPQTAPVSKFFRETKMSHEDIENLVETLKSKNPNAQNIFNDADTIEDLFNSSKDPDVALAQKRAIDNIMDMEEMHVGGFQELVSRYYLVEDIMNKNEESLDKLTSSKTVLPENPNKPSTKKLPTPYGPEVMLRTMLSVIGNLPEDHPNKFLLEILASSFKKSLATNSEEDENEGTEEEEQPKRDGRFGFNPFFNPFDDMERSKKKPEQPVFPQIFHTRQQKNDGENRRRMNPFFHDPPENFSDSNSDDEFGID